MYELSEVIKKDGRMLEWAQAVNKIEVNPVLQLSEEDKAIAETVDKWAKEIGEGTRPYKELSAYFQKVIQPEVYNAPMDLLNMFFEDQPSIGEFDDWAIDKAPKNTLQAYEAAKNGNVKKSYIDFEKIAPVNTHLQIETEIKMADLRKNGFKTIARMTQYAIDELRNKMFFSMFNTIDSTIVGAAQTATVATAPDKTTMDKLAKYVRSQLVNGMPVTISNSDRAYEISEVPGATLLSDTMRDQINNTGVLALYRQLRIMEIAASRETGNGDKLINANRVYGIAGTIGEKALKGELRVLSSEDINNEVINLKFTGFEFTYAITYPEKVFKLTIS